ncbi:FAD-binding and (Fe-S)-binding domain-containing protein [Flavilitoribacter nigricans]|uniref:FAD-binding oxidoreductase n=1 Tax=Flavilitoribacter nigricans (strain ATCC 23147 / DSM 23189 / NBRC 102662 / NCIMB 1420 / SS-2) TaxID=1122177 RepID=A0A2D0NBN2_FLAN2|nr:FAD-binding and (Fe-S)-binding domain-containing protein [Flavilitoribacter nigricans]PHN05589.1 FAD-binding oxidoreductase [Flavilitoribacter nigricans DSM 23189 = NBRC 102662]
MSDSIPFSELSDQLEGELFTSSLWRTLYATDGSVYRQLPDAVVLPRSTEDIKAVIRFAGKHQLPIIPRAAGTSLAGQVVGEGIVVDISRHFNRILEVDAEAGWVRVQPGVIRDELNQYLRPYGLFFGPNTSTANRCMIGGMVGNNSCGSTSIVYGSTRDHVLELKTVLSDGSEVSFQALSGEEFAEKCELEGLEGGIYRQLKDALSDPARQESIREQYPKEGIRRRNTGYAVDLLLHSNIFAEGGPDFNACTLLCGSEGTLAFTTEIKLHLNPLPAPKEVVLCAHFTSIDESLRAVQIAMAHQPSACELMDKIILDLTKKNIEQQKNRFFVEGDPAAILMIEFRGATPEEAETRADTLIDAFRAAGFGYAFPKVFAPATKRVWDLRKAGLGILANLPGDPKAVACIEDTAVEIADLPEYIAEFSEMMAEFGQEAVYYAHAGAGEIHLRPILNLKDRKDRQLFYDITYATAQLVKKYRGSLSGEHGDGRVRAPFLSDMIGADNYQLLREIKSTWDPQGIFNPGKIVDAPPMNTTLRYEEGQETPGYDTAFDFSGVGGLLRLAEKCNGSGDCRKLSFAGGVMCPSYRATREEKDTTRGRANVLREFLTRNTKENPFDHPEIATAMDLCISCKGCTAECPSNVDMSTLKSEFQYQYHKSHGASFRTRFFSRISRYNRLGSLFPALSNFFLTNTLTAAWIKSILGVAPQRSLPALSDRSLWKWWNREGKDLPVNAPHGRQVYLFCDEFINYNEAEIGEKTVRLLLHLGYEVRMIAHAESGRAAISKGMLDDARQLARANVETFSGRIDEHTPLLGIEPSAILTFRDEYPNLLRGQAQERARQLAPHCLLVDEFLAREAAAGFIRSEQFHDVSRKILLHGHCHQKALGDVAQSAFLLSLPANYTVEVIPSGCCGMAGSFGYEEEHYDLSMKIGELVLFPAVREAPADAVIAAPGTSCRHQIRDGAERQALHPVEVLWDAVK